MSVSWDIVRCHVLYCHKNSSVAALYKQSLDCYKWTLAETSDTCSGNDRKPYQSQTESFQSAFLLSICNKQNMYSLVYVDTNLQVVCVLFKVLPKI